MTNAIQMQGPFDGVRIGNDTIADIGAGRSPIVCVLICCDNGCLLLC